MAHIKRVDQVAAVNGHQPAFGLLQQIGDFETGKDLLSMDENDIGIVAVRRGVGNLMGRDKVHGIAAVQNHDPLLAVRRLLVQLEKLISHFSDGVDKGLSFCHLQFTNGI